MADIYLFIYLFIYIYLFIFIYLLTYLFYWGGEKLCVVQKVDTVSSLSIFSPFLSIKNKVILECTFSRISK